MSRVSNSQYDEMNQAFDDIEKDPEGFKAAMRQLLGKTGAAWTDFVIEALDEYPDVMRYNPQTDRPKTTEERSNFKKRKADFDKKFKNRLSQLFSELPAEVREQNLASWRKNLSMFFDSNTIEQVLQDLQDVHTERSSDTDTEKA